MTKDFCLVGRNFKFKCTYSSALILEINQTHLPEIIVWIKSNNNFISLWLNDLSLSL